jgi:hypothetical protein
MRSAVEIGTGLRSLGLDGSTALAARFDPEDLHDSVVGDPISACAARQGSAIDGAPAEPAAVQAATAR